MKWNVLHVQVVVCLRFLDKMLAVLNAVVYLVAELVRPSHPARGEVDADLAGG